MKKNSIKPSQIFNREDLKKIRGGDYGYGCPGCNNGNPCTNCTNIAHQLSDGDTYGSGNCNSLPSSQQSGCHNYCTDPGNYTWC